MLASKPEYAVVHVDLQSVGLGLTVRFKRLHLDVVYGTKWTHSLRTHSLRTHMVALVSEIFK